MAAAGLGNLLVTVPLLVGIPTIAGDSGALGWFFALFTAGSLLGAAEAGLVTRTRPMRVAPAGLMLAGTGVALVAVAGQARLFVIAAIGFCIGGFDVRWSAYLQSNVPTGIQIVDRAHKGRDISGLMMNHAKELARSRGATRLRGDCWSGAGGAVLRHYQSLGFDVGDTFTVDTPSGPWPGQVVMLRAT